MRKRSLRSRVAFETAGNDCPPPNLMPERAKANRDRSVVAAVAVSAVIAAVAAVASVHAIQLSPPSAEQRSLQVGTAVTHALVDAPSPEKTGTTIDRLSSYNDLAALAQRATGLAKLMAAPEVVERTARRLGVDPADISAESAITSSVPRLLVEPDSERRAVEIFKSTDPYRLEIQARPDLPVVDIYAQAPSADEARRLADVSIQAFNSYLRASGKRRAIPSADRVRLTQLDTARGGAIDGAAAMTIAGVTFLVVFGVCCGLFALFGAVRRGWRRPSGPPGSASRPSEGPLEADPRGDAWPRTTRPLPWMIAGFIGLLFLVPFNGVALDVSLPIDLNLDRLVLPVIVLVWVVALAAGGSGAPRWRFTPIHAGIGAFAAAAGLSVVLNAGELNQSLVLGLSIKKLSLLSAYIALFLVVASAIRPSEVRPFLKLILGLAVVCAIGVIWEYRFGFNVFYDATVHLFGRFFEVPSAFAGFDELGRREVRGPAELGLEAVAILAMAFPIALVGLLDARRWGARLLYGLAAGLLLLGMLATFRKSGLLAPLTVILTLAVFRPRIALKLAPIAVVGIAALALTSFDAFHSVTDQLQSDHLDVGTVSDRVSDYDAVRPDVLSSPAVGRGFGSYEHTYAPADNRILDSDLLMRLVETGVFGLAAFLLMIGIVVGVAVPVIRGSDRLRAPPALAIAAAATAFGVLAALFDEWSFPHAVYLFLTLAGLLAALGPPRPEPEPARLSARPHGLGADLRGAPAPAGSARERVPTSA